MILCKQSSAELMGQFVGNNRCPPILIYDTVGAKSASETLFMTQFFIEFT